EIRQACAEKLRTVETSGHFAAILGCLLNEDWSTPKLAEVRITPDRCLLGRLEGDVAFKALLGAEAGFDSQRPRHCQDGGTRRRRPGLPARPNQRDQSDRMTRPHASRAAEL